MSSGTEPASAAGNAPSPGSGHEAPPHEVRSEAVMLRRVTPGDAEAIAAAVATSLDHLRPWMPWATADAADPRTQRVRAAEADELWESGSDYIYSVLLEPELTLVGEIGLHRRVGDGGIEIGYWIDAQHVGHGLGTEAARSLTTVALALDGVSRAEIHCDEANAASAAIPRKLGYRLDRIDDHEPEAPGERGRRMIWVMPRSGEDGH
ncbi:MAG TPA: GNAT family N-acetyltransferase [Streptosporangiaceae bacterium]|jgi:RimJ/RimL family protein N-acetyltransferase|nr:GNAT family N-acetyltransferase [Streptosporangiaceae bacterium]